MIRVERTGPIPKPLQPGRAGPRETQRAIDFYVHKIGDRPPTLNAYRTPPVKEALHALFHGKCAYCETNVSAGRSSQVEHWRPKGRILLEDGNEQTPGYFWAAARWDNLFPSCPGCNGEKEEIELPLGNKRLLGKLDRFPLEEGSPRATDEATEAHEKVLLLNPSGNEEPMDHLEIFEAEGHSALYRERDGSKKGITSIRVYGLNRQRLVERRQEVQAEIVGLLEDLRLTMRDLEAGPNPALERAFVRDRDRLLRYLEPTKEYLALARHLILPFLRDNGFPVPGEARPLGGPKPTRG